MAGLGKTAKNILGREKKKLSSFGKTLLPTTNVKQIGENLKTSTGLPNLAMDTEGSLDDIQSAFTPDIPVPEEPTIIPIPDERVSELEARRRRARRGSSGRESTILTEGLGG